MREISLDTIPADDEEAKACLLFGKDVTMGRCMVGIFQINRIKGMDLIPAYADALEAGVGRPRYKGGLTPLQLKQLCLRAEQLHEESYVEASNSYAVSKDEAVRQACSEANCATGWTWYVSFIIRHAWNDIQDLEV
jgi:hypothetical protein